jgi:preprotein translocase subunit SecF
MNIIRLKWLWFSISIAVIVPGVISLIIWGLDLGVDFTGGTLIEEKINNNPSTTQVAEVVSQTGVHVDSVTTTSSGTFLIRTNEIAASGATNIKNTLENKFGPTSQVSLETVGPTIGRELLSKAALALGLASIFIVAYIAWSFRSVPKPTKSWRFGVCAIVALLHDALVVTGVFSILGHFLHVQVDSLFVTALLTVIGFSVHDTIVVFDRIRENLTRMPGKSFADVANASLLQTLVRSLMTSLTVVLTLFAVLLLVGPISEKIKWFLIALLVGVISGTYSSIFNATPLLVVWQEKFSQSKLS